MVEAWEVRQRARQEEHKVAAGCPAPTATLQTTPAKCNSCHLIAFGEIHPCSHKQEKKSPREGRFLYQTTGLTKVSNGKTGMLLLKSRITNVLGGCTTVDTSPGSWFLGSHPLCVSSGSG